MNRDRLKLAFGVFGVVLVAYGLVAWDRVTRPSPQFHFVDLASSFLHGRLDTDTPRQRARPEKPDDPKGYREAIKRTLESGGWNDWARIEHLKLKDGTEIMGRFPWAGEQGEKRHLFHTTDGYEMKVVIPRDLARDCGKSGHRMCRESKHYVSFPPGPALVMLPAVAIWGYDVNDVLITLLFAALNAALLFLLLELLRDRGHTDRSTRENLWLTALFAFGTAAFFSSVRGEVWFTALVFGVTFNLCYILAALDLKRPLLAGLVLGVGVATRVPLAFCFVFFAWQLFFPGNKWDGDRWKEIIVKGAWFAAPLVVIGVALALYNKARFDSFTEFGHTYLSGGAAERIRDQGMFSTFYLNTNLSAALINVPRLVGHEPYVMITKHGVGLLFSTPVLFLLFRPRDKPAIVRALWVTVAVTAIPGLLYQNSGWEQFTYRFAMDYFPYLMLLLAVGGRPITGKVKAVIIWCIIVNLFGAITFGRVPSVYY